MAGWDVKSQQIFVSEQLTCNNYCNHLVSFAFFVIPTWNNEGPVNQKLGQLNKRMGLVYFVISSPHFIHPQNKQTNSERLQDRPIFFLLLTHSGQWSLKKGILCQVLRFCESILLLHPKTIHNSDQAFCKKRKLSLSVCACFVCEWNTEMKYKTN